MVDRIVRMLRTLQTLRSSRALAVLTAIWLVLVLNLVLRSAHPMASLGGWATDHPAHTGAAVLFAHHGFEIYRQRVYDLCPVVADDADWVQKYRAYPGQFCSPAGREAPRPLLVNWGAYPRFYPPGANAYAIVEAVLHEATDLSFHVINEITIAKYLIAALAALLVFSWLAKPNVSAEPVLLLFIALVGSELIRWSLTGFYDAIAVGLIFALVALLRAERYAEALAAFGLAFLLHYRAVWFLPLAMLALLRIVRAKESPRHWSARRWGFVLLGLSSSALATICLYLARPALAALDHNNPLRYATSTPMGGVDVLVVTAIGLYFLVRDRAYIVLAVLAMQLATLYLTPEVRPWHSQFALGLLAVGFLSPHARVRVVLFAMYLVQTVAIFRNPGLPGSWLKDVVLGHF